MTTVVTTTTRAASASQTGTRRRPSSRWVACDASIDALRPHTTCPFAENAFYEYWADDGESWSLLVYSPAAGRSLPTSCADQGTQILCRTEDGGRARFTRAALSAYNARQAGAYAATHETGDDSSSAIRAAAYDDTDSGTDGADAYADPTGDEIPNYDNGTGYRVRCADGMYSQSGSKQGACSGHGGVG